MTDPPRLTDGLLDVINSLPGMPVDDLGTLVGRLVSATPWLVSAQVFLADYQEVELRPLRTDTRPMPEESILVRGTTPGLAFTRQQPVPGADGSSVWVPLTNRGRRFGVVHVSAGQDVSEAQVAEALSVASLLAMIIDGAAQATDLFARARRLAPLSLSAEMQWDLLPPTSIATRGATVAGRLEPAYHVGGDSFDYAVNHNTLHVAIFDPVGHDTRSALLASLVVGTYRHARRQWTSLPDTASAINHEITQHFPYGCFVTGFLCELDLSSGVLSLANAGHEPPVLLRDGHVRQLSMAPHRPWGLFHEDPSGPVVPVHKQLQPGDRVMLFTDGVTQAQGERGGPLGIDGLSQHLVRESMGGHSAPELLRRVLEGATDRRRPNDDATVVLIEWRGPDSSPELGG